MSWEGLRVGTTGDDSESTNEKLQSPFFISIFFFYKAAGKIYVDMKIW